MLNTEKVSDDIDETLSEWGAKVYHGNQSTAYSKTNGFTYHGESQIRGMGASLGKTYVYCEDEYTYDSSRRKCLFKSTISLYLL